MNVVTIILSLGSIGFFASRIFLPAFVTALTLRFGDQIPLLAHSGLLAHFHGQPDWFTSTPCLVVLGILSAIEVLAHKNGEAQRILHEVDIYMKPALAALTSLGLISTTDAGFVRQVSHQAGFGSGILPLITAIGTFWASKARKQVMSAVVTHLGGTSLGRLISWLEELWVVFGMFLLILFPFFMLGIITLALIGLFLARWRFATLEESKRIPCLGCGTLMYPCAMACPKCHRPNPNPVDVGFLGQSRMVPARDLARHPFRLAEKRRCPQCATRLPPGRTFSPCAVCGHSVLGDSTFASQYANHVGRRLPAVLGICYLISSVPILGMIVGVAYYRIELVEPFYQFLPMSRRMLLGVGLTILTLVMILFQWIPALGGLAIPLLALVSFLAYRHTYQAALRARQIPREQTVPGSTVA